jgi:hypothetical protein
MARTTCLVCFISTVNGCSYKKRKEEAPWKAGASSWHITTLSNLFGTFAIYGYAFTPATLGEFKGSSTFTSDFALNLQVY